MKTLAFTVSVLLLSLGACLADDRPNIVLIMADDLGLGDVSHHVRTQMDEEPIVETPAIDALARRSLWFTDGHSATALCSPTRYCVMSGNNNYRSNAPWGTWGTFRESAFVKGEVTLGSVVKDAGYSTGFVGKWHLGGDFRDLKTGGIYRGTGKENKDISDLVDTTKFIGGGPSFCGFDYNFTLPCGIQGPIYIAYENEVWHPLSTDSKIVYLDKKSAINPKDVSDKGPGMGDSAWNTSEIGKLISSKAVDFINRNAKNEAPFFLYYCSPMVHIPHCPPDEFDGKKIKGATPSHHLDMVLDLDQQVNRIVKALEANEVLDDTLIVFVSDNGGLRTKASVEAGHVAAGGWAGYKNSPLEGGHRTPFFAVWKDHIKPGVTNETALNQDMLATFAALLESEIPLDEAQDSNNLLPLLTGKGTFKQRDFIAMQAGSQKELIYRKGPWKLIIKSNHLQTEFEPIGLYNLDQNPFEKAGNNLAKKPEFQSRVDEMFSSYMEIFKSRQRTVPR